MPNSKGNSPLEQRYTTFSIWPERSSESNNRKSASNSCKRPMIFNIWS